MDDTGIVDENVNRSELGTNATEKLPDGRFVTDVALTSERADTQLSNKGGGFETGLGPFAIANRDRRAAPREGQGDRPPNAPRATRDDGHPASQSQIVHATWPASGRKSV
jgi:hypothetical protein